jgi:hypothetical protein
MPAPSPSGFFFGFGCALTVTELSAASLAPDGSPPWISPRSSGASVGEPTMLEHSEVLFDYLVDAAPVVATCPDATGRLAPETELPFATATSASNGIIASAAAAPPWSEICFFACVLLGNDAR